MMQNNTVQKFRGIQYDGKISLAEGRSRKETKWKNKQLDWSELVNKLSVTTRTRESAAQYRGMTREDQGYVKDVGGFVGGTLKSGRRKAGSVGWRSLITLDADFANPELWPHISLLFGNAICMYSTHSHSQEHYKVRLVAPLSRQVTADEYQAISRFIAAEIGIDIFDDTTYQPERLMYWPSTSSDGEFLFEFLDGPWLDPDKILTKYPEWRDASTWPESSRATKIHLRHAEKQGDPLEKPGIIGAFNRTYDIHQAISTFLSEVYDVCDVPNRYTFTAGTASAGVVTYDDRFSFSHHGTDPTSGSLCNAFDLVRVHLYGIKDEDAKDGTPINMLPSYKAMGDHVLKDPNVRIELASTKQAEAADDFSVAYEDDNAWKAKLQYSDKGAILQTIHNALLILRHDPGLKGAVALDLFTRDTKLKTSAPWRTVKAPDQWTDSDDASLRHYLEIMYGLKKREGINDAVQIIQKENGYHPIRDFLDDLAWDGVKRLDTVLIDFLGVEDTPYSRAVSRKWLTAAVGRIRQPGIKFDYMLILIGSQGLGKSQFFSRLSRRFEWFSDSMSKFDNSKDSMEQLAGKWIIELGELSAMKRYEVEHVKVFLSKQEDTYRPSYGRRSETYKRQCVFGGTTNREDFLQDATGARRFWPVKVEDASRMWREMTPEVVDQLWAEADLNFKLGEPLYLQGDADRIAKELQEQYTEMGGKAGAAEDFLSKQIPVKWNEWEPLEKVNWLNGNSFDDGELALMDRDHVSGVELYVECFNGRIDTYARKDAYEMSDILISLGWVRSSKTLKLKGYGKQRIFDRSNRR